MHEERDTEFVTSPSLIKTTLAVAGALAGLMLLVCGGAAGYVALKSSPESEANLAESSRPDPAEVADDASRTDRPGTNSHLRVQAREARRRQSARLENLGGLRHDEKRGGADLHGS